MPMKQVFFSFTCSLLIIIGCSIGTMQDSNVVVNTSVSNAYEVQPNRQEWVSVIECVSAAGERLRLMSSLKDKT